MKKAVYIGSGLDISPILSFSFQIKEYIYIDSRPFSMYGYLSYDEITDSTKSCLKRNERYINGFSDKTFISRLIKLLEINKFIVTEHQIDYIIFQKDDIILRYFYSSTVNDSDIHKYMDGIDTLIIMGHDPDKKILEIIQKPFYLIVDNKTVYESEEDEKDRSTIYSIEQNPDLILNFILLQK